MSDRRYESTGAIWVLAAMVVIPWLAFSFFVPIITGKIEEDIGGWEALLMVVAGPFNFFF